MKHVTELKVKQGSEEWMRVRDGIITCSKFGALLGSTAEKNRYLQDLRHAPENFESAPTTWGKVHEDEARANYSIATGLCVTECGFLLSNHITGVGGSPDGLILHNDEIIGGVEIKCPFNPEVHLTHIQYGLPYRYFWQVQGYIWLTGAQWWDFVSYDSRHTSQPLFYSRLTRDALAMKSLGKAIEDFIDVFKTDSWFADTSARSVILSGALNSFLVRNGDN